MTTKLVASTPPDLQTLLNFEKKRQTEVEGAIGAATIKDREGFVPQADPTDTGIFSSPGEISARDALNKAAESAGLLTPEGADAISDTVQEWLAPAEFDPNFKLTDLEADPKNAAFLKETFGRRDAMDTRFHEALAGAANREVAQSMINDYVNDRQRFEDASGAGLAVEMLGGAVGATRDIVMTAPFLWGGATAARAMTEIAGKALELGIVTSGEAALAYAERVVRGQRDYTIDGHTEGLISAAFAGGLTFGVGAFAFRKSAASSLAKALEEGRLAETLQTQQPGGGTVSAQAAPVDERGVVLQKTGSTLLARFFFQKLRSPKGRVQDVGADVAQRVANDAPGSSNELTAHQILDGLLGPEIDRVDASGQAVVRTKSLEDAFDEARTIDGIIQKTVRMAHLDLDKLRRGGVQRHSGSHARGGP
jgi:hypothetical protein